MFCDVVVQFDGGACAYASDGHSAATVKTKQDRMRRMDLLLCNVRAAIRYQGQRHHEASVGLRPARGKACRQPEPLS